MEERRELFTLLDYLETLSKQDHKKNVYKALIEISFLTLQEKITNLKDRYGDLLFRKKDAHIIEDVLSEKVSFQPMKKEYSKIYEYISSIHSNMSRDPIKYMNTKDLHFNSPLQIPGQIIFTPRDPVYTTICIIIEAIRLTHTITKLSPDMTRNTTKLILGLISILKGETRQGLLTVFTFIYEATALLDLYKRVIFHILDFIAPDILENIKPVNFLLWGFINFASEEDHILARDFINSISEDNIFTLKDFDILQSSNEFPVNLPVLHLIMKLMRK